MVKTVKIYSIPTCSYCIRAKQFLKDNNVDYEDLDVSNNEMISREMIQKSGQMGVPVLEIDGEIIIGFDKEKIKRALHII